MLSWLQREINEDTGAILFYWKDSRSFFYMTYDLEEAERFEWTLIELWKDGFKLGKEEAKLTEDQEPF